MKILDNIDACYGCGACFNICPTEAIRMEDNAEGFLEPIINEVKCISCGKCKKVCPAINYEYPNEANPDIFAFSAEEKVLYNSSSGGIFSFLAEHILRMGGYVVGAAYDSGFYVNHVMIHSLEELDRVRRSKYLQSFTGDTYKKTKILLEKGEIVLYSGCPCQIAGLLRFLGKDYDNLYTVDLLCHGVPSPELFQEHLNNSFGGKEKIEDVEFRDREGWNSLFKVKLKNGEVKTSYNSRSVYMQSFLQNINLRASCFKCQYSRVPRQGDVTIGDLWAAGILNLSFEYRKGVSIVLINNEKGRKLFKDALFKPEYEFHIQKLYGKGVENPCNIKLLNENIFHSSAHDGDFDRRQKFFENYSDKGFENAVYLSLHKFDVGLVLYMSNNYGSIATNYALYRVISDSGRKVAVLDNLFPLFNEAAMFAKEHMELCGKFMEKNDWKAADQCFQTFVVGSDMSWNWRFTSWDRLLQFRMLGFVSEKKRMISYAPSFGEKRGKEDLDKDIRNLCSYCLKRFDAISVREDYGVEMCGDLFGIQAEQVLDPVLLCSKEIWDELSATSQLKFEEGYVLAYILNPTQYKRQTILEAAKILNKKLVVILDLEINIEANKKAMNLDDKIVRPGFIDWLAYFRHADYVITDSFHGVCFSIVYRKKFIAIKNRSKERFDSLARIIGYPSLFFEEDIPLLDNENIFADIDYDIIHKCIELKRIESEKWLYSALNIEVKPKSSNDSVNLMVQLFQSLQEKKEHLSKLRRAYAYEEEQKKEIAAQMKTGITWLDAVFLRNHIISKESILRKTNNLYEYFSNLKKNSKYVVVLSGKDECSNYRRKFVETSGWPLRMDVVWRNSYVAVIDEGIIKIDEKSKEEVNVNYEFVIGHPNYSVEYLDGKLEVRCMPLKYCGIRIKSKGFTEPTGATISEIIVNNINYSMNKTGINMVVIDKETGDVVDSVNINTYADATLRINRA